MLTLTTAMWVHGLIAEAEYPVDVVVKGWGKEFVGHHSSNWFHIPITTPAILEGDRPKLANVHVLYKTNGTVIKALHIYNGPTKVQEIPIDPPLEGDHSVSIDASNSWVIYPPLDINYGLGISIFVTNKYYKGSQAQGVVATSPGKKSAAKKSTFTKEAVSILFTAAGADFEAPGPVEPGPGPDTLYPNLNLVRGSWLESKNGKYRLEFDSNGNLFLYNVSDPQTHLFETNTYAPAGLVADANCHMEDGSLVVWRSGMGIIWNSETGGHPGAFLRVEDGGKVSIIDPVNRIWRKPD